MTLITPERLERFWTKVNKSNDCWLWTAAIAKTTGYGHFITTYAHRFAWELANGKIPSGMHVLHRCDNRHCVKLDHLFIGSNHLWRMELNKEQRFWDNVQKTATCWLWTAGTTTQGYGVYGGNKQYAHRYSWILHNGEIPEKQFVLHRCDNPPCVNPAHLFIGDSTANVHDMMQKGRDHFGTRKLTAEQVTYIRAQLARGAIQRRLAEQLGVDPSNVSNIHTKKIWKRRGLC